jgi:hypothetical protein
MHPGAALACTAFAAMNFDLANDGIPMNIEIGHPHTSLAKLTAKH